jgi:hypothetical protein
MFDLRDGSDVAPLLTEELPEAVELVPVVEVLRDGIDATPLLAEELPETLELVPVVEVLDSDDTDGTDAERRHEVSLLLLT